MFEAGEYEEWPGEYEASFEQYDAAPVNEDAITAPDYNDQQEADGSEGVVSQGEPGLPAHLDAQPAVRLLPSGLPETDVYDRVKALGVPEDEILVVGDSALETVLGAEIRKASELTVAVSEGAYAHFRTAAGMEEVMLPDGSLMLKGNGMNMSRNWNGKSLQELQGQAYVGEGVTVAGLPDVYEYKQDRGQQKDHDDLEVIRQRLYDKPLPPALLEKELQFVQAVMPERLRGRPEVQVAANGLYVVRTLFGTESDRIRYYGGPVELGNVPATYHAWEHSAQGVRAGQENITVVEQTRREMGLPLQFTDDDRLATAAGYANHDVVLGHGRRAMNPDAHDERQSADLAVRHLEAVGVTNEQILEKTHASIMATTYNERTHAQDVDASRGHVLIQELNAGADMSVLKRPSAAVDAVRITIEDLGRLGAGYDRPLQHLLGDLQRGVMEGEPLQRIQTIADGLQLVDQYPDYPVTKPNAGPQGEPVQTTLRNAFADRLAGSGKFYASYEFPESWQLGSAKIQRENAAFTQQLAERFRAGELTATEVYEAAQAYAMKQREQE